MEMSALYPRDLIDFSGKIFRAAAFNFPPYSILDFKNNKFDGIEYNIANEAAKSLNMIMEVHNPADGYNWGFEKEPGKFTGVVGEVQFELADICWGHLFIYGRRLKIMDFSQWYFIDKTCVMVPTSKETTSKVFKTLEPFQLTTWIGVLVMMAAMVISYIILAFGHKEKK